MNPIMARRALNITDSKAHFTKEFALTSLRFWATNRVAKVTKRALLSALIVSLISCTPYTQEEAFLDWRKGADETEFQCSDRRQRALPKIKYYLKRNSPRIERVEALLGKSELINPEKLFLTDSDGSQKILAYYLGPCFSFYEDGVFTVYFKSGVYEGALARRMP